MKRLKMFLFFIIIVSGISCDSSDDEINFSSLLIGEWQRSDFSEDFKYTLTFNSDNTGFKVVQVGNMDTGITSSLIQYNWNLKDEILTIEELDVIIETTYLINSEDQLVLKEYSDLPFNRID